LVSISDADELNTFLSVYDIKYITTRNIADVSILFRVAYPRETGRYTEEKLFSIEIKTSDDEIKKLKDKLEENNRNVNLALETYKDRIKALLTLKDSVDVNLKEILNLLFEVAKKGFDVKG